MSRHPLPAWKKEKAKELRARSWTHKNIAAVLYVSQRTIGFWLNEFLKTNKHPQEQSIENPGEEEIRWIKKYPPNVLFFFKLAELLKTNGGVWEGEIVTLSELLEFQMTPRTIYNRLLRHSAETCVQVEHLDARSARLKLKGGKRCENPRPVYNSRWCSSSLKKEAVKAPRVYSYPSNALFFFELIKLMKKNGGEWEGEIEKLPELIELPMTPYSIYHRLSCCVDDYRVKVLELDRRRARLMLVERR